MARAPLSAVTANGAAFMSMYKHNHRFGLYMDMNITASVPLVHWLPLVFCNACKHPVTEWGPGPGQACQSMGKLSAAAQSTSSQRPGAAGAPAAA